MRNTLNDYNTQDNTFKELVNQTDADWAWDMVQVEGKTETVVTWRFVFLNLYYISKLS